MKKTMGTLIASVVLMTSFQVKAEMTTMDYLKDYGLPCAAAFAGGLLASKDHGAAIGVGVCLGVGTATYLQTTRETQRMRDEDFKKFQKMMDDNMARNNVKLSEKTDAAIEALSEKQSGQIEGIRQAMKEVIAERLTLMGEEVKGDVKRYVEKAEFMQDLEKKVMMKIKEETRAEAQLRQKETVEQAVDEVMKQVVLKRVGVPEAQ